jgi:integrase
MATRRLTDEYIKTLPIPPPKDGKPCSKLWWDNGRGAIPSLALRITSGGARTWVNVARYPSGKQANGKHNPTGRRLGSWPDMRLPEAREIAFDWNRDIARGIDPQEKLAEEARAKQTERLEREREEARKKAGTFSNVAEKYIARVTPQMRTGHNAARIIRNDLISRWGSRPAGEISRTDVIDLVEDINERGLYAAHAAFNQARSIFAWLLMREDPRRPQYGIESNPCSDLDLDKLLGSQRKPRAHTLTHAEIAALWRSTEGDSLTGYPINQYIRLLLILGVRRNELAEAKWDEFDLTDPDKATWRLAATRTKNEEPRVIPLPRAAVDILNAMPRFSGSYLFSGTGGRAPITNFSRLKEEIDKKIATVNDGKTIAPWRFHDLRRSMRTNLSAIATISPIVAELMIGHVQKGILRVYDQHKYTDEMRAGFEAWCGKLRTITKPTPANVVQMERARA